MLPKQPTAQSISPNRPVASTSRITPPRSWRRGVRAACSDSAPTADGSALVVAEVVGRRLSKDWLSGPKAGTAESLAVNLPGMPDNLSTGADGRLWCAFVASANAALERLFPRAP